MKGSASVIQQDVIVGHAWMRVAKVGVLLWFDRVDSKLNPVDGIGRKKSHGPWFVESDSLS